MSYVDPRAGSMAAQIAGKSREMDVVAERGVRAVQSVAAAHRLTGNYSRNVFSATVPSVLPSKVGPIDDRLIIADDEAAVSIEYGHTVPSTGEHVPGLHIMGKALEAMG